LNFHRASLPTLAKRFQPYQIRKHNSDPEATGTDVNISISVAQSVLGGMCLSERAQMAHVTVEPVTQ